MQFFESYPDTNPVYRWTLKSSSKLSFLLLRKCTIQAFRRSLDTKKSVGPDSISPQVLKEARHQIALILTFIYNQSLSSGVVPDDWCTANIFALHKKDPKDLAENYQPISLTSICSKILEHIVYSSISRFLENNSILAPRQHGFRTGHSCEAQLVYAINDWAKALDHGYQSDVAIFDFFKAFDSVPHWHWLRAPLALHLPGGWQLFVTTGSTLWTQQCSSGVRYKRRRSRWRQ